MHKSIALLSLIPFLLLSAGCENPEGQTAPSIDVPFDEIEAVHIIPPPTAHVEVVWDEIEIITNSSK